MLAGLFLNLASFQLSNKWSADEAGIVAKIEVERKGEKDRTPKLTTFLTLKNTSDVIGTIDVYLSLNNLKLWLEDESGEVIPEAKSGVNGRNGFMPNPFWLLIPFDSTVRMNLNLNGYFPPPPGELLIESESGLLYVPKGFKNKVFLGGEFQVIDPPHEARSHRWEGTLKLPRILIFDGKKIVSTKT